MERQISCDGDGDERYRNSSEVYEYFFHLWCDNHNQNWLYEAGYLIVAIFG